MNPDVLEPTLSYRTGRGRLETNQVQMVNPTNNQSRIYSQADLYAPHTSIHQPLQAGYESFQQAHQDYACSSEKVLSNPGFKVDPLPSSFTPPSTSPTSTYHHPYQDYGPTSRHFQPPSIFESVQDSNKRSGSPSIQSNHSCSSSNGSHHPSSNMDEYSHRSRRRNSTTHHNHYQKKPCPSTRRDDSTDKEEDGETCSSRCTVTPTETDESSKKQNHSEIEKRRRDKMNTYITELSEIVPVCGVASRKLDKLTVLRMAVQHMKTIRGTQLHSYTEGHYKPSYISDTELKHLILQAAEGFLFVVGCDRGKLLYVSESVTSVLNYKQSELLGHSWFDILHPKDVAKVKEQLNDLAPRERLLIDIRTGSALELSPLQHHWGNRLCPGARRTFFCRMKRKPSLDMKRDSEESIACGSCVEEPNQAGKDSSLERKYCVIYCTGYMKPWPKSEKEDTEGEMDTGNSSVLIAVGRILPPLRNQSETSGLVTFTSRHASDGKFVFIDQRATLVFGFLPQELIGTSMYDFFHSEDISRLEKVHKAAISGTEALETPIYRFRTSDASYVSLQSNWKAFRNPWTQEVECLLSTNRLIQTENNTDRPESTATYSEPMQSFPPIQGEELKLERSTPNPEESPPNLFPTLSSLESMETIQPVPDFCPNLRTNTEAGHLITNLTPVGPSSSVESLPLPQHFSSNDLRGLPLLNSTLSPDEEMLLMMGDPRGGIPDTSDGGGTDDEAAMAVILSLLEGEAALTQTSDIPWSLS